jgi:hypothetical protein
MKARTPQEIRIRKLEDDLYFARRTVFQLLASEAREILDSPTNLDSPMKVHAWFRAASEQILELADVLNIDEPTRHTQRAICPLCGESAQDYYRRGPGFVYPEGLRRHLLGAHGCTQCDVTKIALDEALISAETRARYPR